MFLGEIYAKFTHRIQQYVKRIQTYGQVCFIPIKKWMKDASLESQADEKLVPGRRFSLLSHQGCILQPQQGTTHTCRKSQNKTHGKDAGRLVTHAAVGMEVVQLLGKTAVSLKIKHETTIRPTVTLLGVYPRETKT